MSSESVDYTAMLLGATGNAGGRILHLLVASPRCRKVIVVTRRNVAELAHPNKRTGGVNSQFHNFQLAN